MGTTNFSVMYVACLELLVIHKKMRNNKINSLQPSVLNAGRHFCLWCLITQNDIRLDDNFALRTLESIISDNDRFIHSGGNPKNVKNFNNALRKPIFNIPLTQVYTTRKS